VQSINEIKLRELDGRRNKKPMPANKKPMPANKKIFKDSSIDVFSCYF